MICNNIQVMELRKTNILHLRLVSEQGKCIVEGCHKWQEPRYYTGGFYVLCAGHRRLARDKFLGNVSKDYIPTGRSVFSEHPICAVEGCGGYCQYDGTSNWTGKRKFRRYCPSHASRINGRSGRPKKQWTNYNLPLPPLIDETLIVKCEVDGCNENVARHSGLGIFRKRCPKHYRLKQLGLPDDYVYIPPEPKGYKRTKCVVDGCDRLQANKGIYECKRRYDLYCEYHRRGNMKVVKKGRLVVDTKKCSKCGWVGPCDKHRIINGKDGGKYEVGNVVVVCPNCHRMIHLGSL
jgi:hypothetical protein